MDWRPIDSAPQDGRPVLLYDPVYKVHMGSWIPTMIENATVCLCEFNGPAGPIERVFIPDAKRPRRPPSPRLSSWSSRRTAGIVMLAQAVHDVGGQVVCAWGALGAYMSRGDAVRGWFRGEGLYVPALHRIPLHHLGLTKHGHPRHPLYLRGDTVPEVWA